MKTIIETPGEPYMIEDRWLPVFEVNVQPAYPWWNMIRTTKEELPVEIRDFCRWS